MERLNKLLEETEDEDRKSQLKLARYIYNDLVTEQNRQLLDDYTDTLIKALQVRLQPKSLSPASRRFKQETIAHFFYDYLRKEGKTDYTAYDYVKRVERICNASNRTIEELSEDEASIKDLIDQYTKGDKAEENKNLHNAPSSALIQFQKFVKSEK